MDSDEKARKEIDSYEVERSLLSSAYFQLKETVKKLEERESEHAEHLLFMESVDKVNKAIQSAGTLEQVMRDVLNVTLTIFDSDRAWLFYPADPDTPTFRVPMEVNKPEYPGAGILNMGVPLFPDGSKEIREALGSDGPVTYIIGTESPVDKNTAEQFGVKSQMMTVLYPKSGKPWMFGMHQCSRTRVWTDEEKRLFQEIGVRLADGLTSMLYHRDLQEKNRLLRMISGVNQALIHAKEETELLKETVRVVEESGEYNLAWIGFKGDDEAKVVLPVAYAGFEPGYLEAAHITWADGEYGIDPVGVALRTGKVQIVSDISAEPIVAPWHKPALDRGHISLAVLPLKDDNQVLGVLAVYSNKNDSFSEEEVKILQELVDDLAFGISSLRSSKDVESMNKLMVGRELKMVELKNEIESLRREVAAQLS